MAIKTQSELLALSSANFPDNTTAEITPEKHREWNGDAIDSMFVIAGRTMTIADYNTARTGNNLVPGCNYRFSQINIPAMAGNPFDLIVTALTDSTISDWGFIVSSGSYIRAFVPQDILLVGIKVAELQTGSLNAAVDFKDLAADGRYYGWTEVPVEPTVSDNFPVVHERIATVDGTTVLNHNIEAESALNEKIIGFHPTDSTGYEPTYFYPDNGNQIFYGPSFADAINEVGFVTDIIGSQISDIANVRVNWHKVNTTIFGMVAFDAVFNLGSGGDPWVTFTLPHAGPGALSAQVIDSVIGHGHAIDTSTFNHVVLVSVTGVSSGLNPHPHGRCTLNLIGNHNNPINVRVEFSFSYSIQPYA